MKKVLLGSTALVAAGLMAGPAFAQLEIRVTGSVDYHFGFTQEDKDTDRRSYGNTTDTTLNFDTDGVADNGLEYGSRINVDDTFNGNGDNSFQIDETWIYVRGGFGEFRFGEEDNVASNFRFAVPTVGNGQADGDFQRYLNPGATGFFGTDFAYSSDDTKLIYFWQGSGFTVGASFSPTDDASRDDPSMGEKDGAVLTAGGDLENILAVGGNYKGTFTNGSWGISAGLVAAKNEDEEPSVGEDDDWLEYGLGFEVGFRGFTGGGFYIRSEPNDDVDIDQFGLGGTYTTGAWGFGASYIYGKIDDPGIGFDPKDNVFGVGVEYALADGLTPYADLVWFDFDRDGGASDNDGGVFLVGITASF